MVLLFLIIGRCLQAATVYEWDFDSANLNSTYGPGIMSYADGATPGLTSFGTTDGVSVPNIGGVQAKYMSVPAFTGSTNGYLLDFAGSNAGGTISNYSLVMDVYSPGAANWQALFNTTTSNTNDADFYIDPTGKVGIADIGYSSTTFSQNAWHRLTFTADVTGNVFKYYLDGSLIFTGGSVLGARFGLSDNTIPGADLLLFNEGDSSGVYTHDMLVNSVGFVDRTFSDGEVAALGGPSAGTIFTVTVPEPAQTSLFLLGVLSVIARRRR